MHDNTSRGRAQPDAGEIYKTDARGFSVLDSPRLNKGTAFTMNERRSLGLTGLIPAHVSNLDTQVRRSYAEYERLPDALSKNIYLSGLHGNNEVLFFRLFSEHLRDMIPIVNDLTVGMAMEHYSHECRFRRGLYLSIDHPQAIEESFRNLQAGPGDIDILLATDAEHILGVGDWGLGGIAVAIGKLAICSAAGGVDPNRVIPVMLDVGTDRHSLLDDPLYIGNHHPRVRREQYDAFIDTYVKVASQWFPEALLLWEDFHPVNGRRILDRYKDRICTFNDDMQGTGAITLAGLISALRVCGTPMRSQRVVIFGAGTAGIGIADSIRDAMMRDGLSEADAVARIWCVDSSGLITTDMERDLSDHQLPYARPSRESGGWKRELGTPAISLAEVVHRVRPTILIGASGVAEAFTESIIREMASATERPIVFTLSKPHTRSEVNPANFLAWTEGRGLTATGSPCNPVTHKGVTCVVAHLDNALVYPGLALGVIVSRAKRISGTMIAAAASAVSSLVTVRHPGASLLPHADDLRRVSATVAAAVAEAARNEGLARVKLGDIVQQVNDAMWSPVYRSIRPC
jgi:malate dehydrogenase (oxaloacetate-decarboxylating)